MEKLLDKEPIKRVREFLAKFDPALKILVLDRPARTAKEAADSLKCEVGSIVKTLLLRMDHLFLICLVAGDKKCSINKSNNKCSKRLVSKIIHRPGKNSLFTIFSYQLNTPI